MSGPTPFVIGQGYVEGLCRNEGDEVRSHLYKETPEGLVPMCGWGWNRSDGEGFSIFRGHRSNRGCCKTCIKKMKANKPPVTDGWPHKTKWI